MTWRTVVLTKDSKISLRMNHLVIKNDSLTKISLEEIGQLVIENPNIVMTGHLLNALAEKKIMTIFCNQHHLPYSQLNLIYGHFHQVSVIKKQIEWLDERKDFLWTEIVKQKIRNQRSVLMQYGKRDEAIILTKYIEQVEIADETNREGIAAKVYFNALYGRSFVRGFEDPINWGLNYGYQLLHSLITRIVITKGLLTQIGIHHHSQYNHQNLSSDIIEVFRPLIDIIVKKHIESDFGRNEKNELLEIFNKKIEFKNRLHYVSNAVELFVDSLIRFMETGNSKLIVLPNIPLKKG